MSWRDGVNPLMMDVLGRKFSSPDKFYGGPNVDYLPRPTTTYLLSDIGRKTPELVTHTAVTAQMHGVWVLPDIVNGGAGTLPRLRHKDKCNVMLMDGHSEAFGDVTFSKEGIKAGEPDLFEFKIDPINDFFFN